jgi:hypothetical protein
MFCTMMLGIPGMNFGMLRENMRAHWSDRPPALKPTMMRMVFPW